MSFTFTKATKEGLKARLALAGPAGSGKTWTGLTIASEWVRREGGRIALIDTERRSASEYSDEFDFDTAQLTTFEPLALVDGLAAAAQAGFGVVMVDSLSHFWEGEGGMLTQVDNASKRNGGGNSFAGWKTARPMEQRMLNALLAYPGHVIVCMRTKTEYVVEEDSRGRKAPRKIGLKPIQRDGIEYEFQVVGDLDYDNTLVITKTRVATLGGAVIQKPGAEFGGMILDWLGKPAPTAMDIRERAVAPDATAAELRVLWEDAQRRQLLGAAVTLGSATLTLGDLLVERGKALAATAAEATEQTEQTEEAQS